MRDINKVLEIFATFVVKNTSSTSRVHYFCVLIQSIKPQLVACKKESVPLYSSTFNKQAVNWSICDGYIRTGEGINKAKGNM